MRTIDKKLITIARHSASVVIPAKAGIQLNGPLDSRLRGNDIAGDKNDGQGTGILHNIQFIHSSG